MSAPGCSVEKCILARGHGGSRHLYPSEVGTEAFLANMLGKVRRVPDPTYKCRCGSVYRNGLEVSVGWVEASTEGRGAWRRCEVCNKRGTNVAEISRESRAKAFT